jgi:hypothetical protein
VRRATRRQPLRRGVVSMRVTRRRTQRTCSSRARHWTSSPTMSRTGSSTPPESNPYVSSGRLNTIPLSILSTRCITSKIRLKLVICSFTINQSKNWTFGFGGCITASYCTLLAAFAPHGWIGVLHRYGMFSFDIANRMTWNHRLYYWPQPWCIT